MECETAATRAADTDEADDAKVSKLLRRLGAWNQHEGRFAKCSCASCSKISPWGCLLKQLGPKVEERKQRIALSTTIFDRYFENRDCVAVQCLWYIFAWLADQLSHPCVDKGVFKGCEAAWPSQDITDLPDGVAKYLYGTSLPNIDPSLLDASSEPPLPPPDRSEEQGNQLQREFLSLCKSSAAQLLGELDACECPSMETLNAFSLQSIEMRRERAWSIPSKQALALLKSYAPLVEIGCGTGFWADLLRAEGADIVSYNSESWMSELAGGEEGGEHRQCGVDDKMTFGTVLPGGPEVLDKHGDRTLVLMWPDYMGQGTFGVECLEKYDGEFLILVGEWQGRTWGNYLPGLCVHGQSFSLEFQQAVSSAFEEIHVQRLPNWPLFMDCVGVYKRRSLESLIAEQPAQGHGPDLLTAFLSGAYDPFAGLDEDVPATGADILSVMAAAEAAEEGAE